MASAIIDIHIPAYNEERHIGVALQALAQQTYPHFQVTIHDNASTDRTQDICREFAEKDPRFTLRVNARNIGRELNSQRCLFYTEHEFFMMRSANDAITPDCLEKLVAVMQADPQASLVYAGAELIDNDGQVLGTVPENALYETDVRDIFRSAQIVMGLYTYSMPIYGLMRTSALSKCRLRPYNYGNDHINICEMALYGNIRCVKEPLFKFRFKGPSANWYEDVSRYAAAQVEEADRGVPTASGFFPLEQHLPFIHMACGHIEMFSKAQIEHQHKERLCAIACEIFSKRFGRFIEIELQIYARRLSEALARLGEMGRVERAYFLRRALAELNRVTLVLPDARILREQRQAVAAAIESE